MSIWKNAYLDEIDIKKHLTRGFNRANGRGDVVYIRDDEEVDAGLLAITQIMSEQLTQHFEFGFAGVRINPYTAYFYPLYPECPLVFFGGYASDGSIVGVLSCPDCEDPDFD